MRALFAFSILLPLTFTMAVACGGDDSSPPGDAGADAGGGTDAGGTDGGHTDAGRTDGGSAGCTEDCEWVDVVSGASQSCALRANGTVQCWGANIFGQLGDGNVRHGIECGMSGGADPEDCSPPVVVASIDDATALSSRGGLSSCVLRASGEVWCWGLQSVGDVGGSDAQPRHYEPELRAGFTGMTTLSDGFAHLCAVGAAGAATCIGENSSGQIGNGTAMEARTAATLADPTGFVEIEAATSSDITCGRTSSGEVWCWGSNSDTQLGDGVPDHTDECMGVTSTYDCSLSPVQVMLPKGAEVVDLSVGSGHVCAVTSDGTLLCWGANNYGQLGMGDTDVRALPTEVPGLTNIVAVSAGYYFTCALDSAGAVYCFGDNKEGSLGDGEVAHTGCTSFDATDCSSVPVQVDGLVASKVAAGYRHACAIRTTGEIACWGYNTHRQLGDGTRERRYTPVEVQGLR